MKKLVTSCSVGVIVALTAVLWPEALRTSEEAQRMIAEFEDCRLTPYYCPAGVLTVGMGSTGRVENRQYSDQEVAERWKNDLTRAEKCVNQNFNGEKAPQQVFEAMTDAAFNMGCSGLMWFTDRRGLKQRTTIWKNAQAGDWPAVCVRLTDFVNAGGRPLKGLVNRRTAFKAWCLSAPELERRR